MAIPHLTVSNVRACAVVSPLARPIRTAISTIPSAPLVLIDVTTREGVVGSAYIFAYTPAALPALRRLVVAHGLWTMDEFGSRAWHISRNSLTEDRHFGDPEALARLTEAARRCMVEVATISRDKAEDAPGVELLHIEVGDPEPKLRKAPGKPKK